MDLGRIGPVLLLIVSALGGCARTASHARRFDIAPTTGLVALDVRNFRGSVEVRVDPRAGAATVMASAAASAALGDEQARALEEIWMDAVLREEGARATLEIRTGSPRENTGDHWVDVEVRLPRCDGVAIENTGGVVLVVGARGGTTITNRLGPVEVRTNQPMTEPVTITTTDADIYYQVPAGSSGAFDLESLDGPVWYRDRVQSTDRAYSSPGRYEGRLHGGTSPVVMRTNRGAINVWVDEDPVALTRVFKRELPEAQDLLYLQGSRTHTRNLPEDHPGVMRKPAAGPAYHDSY
jgi:hypothetical protein